jgi:AcrR family transcriptional regulator
LRAALLDAAAEAVRDGGVQSVSMRGLAERAGVSRSAPYRHFDSKAALLAAVAEQGFGELTSRLEAADEGEAQQELKRFRQMGISYVEFAVEHPARYRLMFGPTLTDREGHPELDAAASAAFEQLTEGVAACQEAGSVRAEPPAREGLAQMAWATVHGLSMLLVDRQIPGGTSQELAALVTGLLWEGLRPQEGGDSP